MNKLNDMIGSRVWTKRLVAARFGKSLSWLRAKLPTLEAEGFPAFDPLLGGFDSIAVENWFSQRTAKDTRPNEKSMLNEELLQARAKAIADEKN